MSIAWTARAETPADEQAICAFTRAAFPTAAEAGLVHALRRGPDRVDRRVARGGCAIGDGTVVGHALLTRCLVGGVPALALAPCSVVPHFNGSSQLRV